MWLRAYVAISALTYYQFLYKQDPLSILSVTTELIQHNSCNIHSHNVILLQIIWNLATTVKHWILANNSYMTMLHIIIILSQFTFVESQSLNFFGKAQHEFPFKVNVTFVLSDLQIVYLHFSCCCDYCIHFVISISMFTLNSCRWVG